MGVRLLEFDRAVSGATSLPGAMGTITSAMRGLVGFLALTIAALGVLSVIAVQMLVPALVEAAVRGSPAFAGRAADVQVRTSLEGVLVHGWVDAVVIDGSGPRVGSLTVDRIQATATDVGLIDRRFASLSGVLSGVSVATPNGNTIRLESVAISSSSGALTIVGQVAPAVLEEVITSELTALGIEPAQVRFENGAIQINVHGTTVVASLRVDGSNLVLDAPPELSTIRLVAAPSDGAWRLTQVTISPTGAVITAVVDPGAFGLGG